MSELVPPADNNTSPARSFFEPSTEKAANWVFCVLLVYVCVRSLVGAEAKIFWYDEICTYAVTSQATIHDSWEALKRAADTNPPAYYLVERASSLLTGNHEIGYRIPSIIAFICTLWCSFVFVRKRIGSGGALISSAALLLTIHYDHYAIEARPYSIVVALVALAVVCYQKAPAGNWVALMALSFVLAETFHYYAFYSVVPFAVAEAVWFFKTKELRIRVWLACASGILPILVFWPFLRILKQYYGTHFWAQPTLYDTAKTYSFIFMTPQAKDAALSLYTAVSRYPALHTSTRSVNVIFAAILLAASVAGASLLARKNVRSSLGREPNLHEHVLALAFFALPLVGFIAARLTHGGFTPRYVLATTLAVPLAMKFLLTQLKRGWALALSVFMLLLLAGTEAGFWRSDRARPSKLTAPIVSVENLVDAAKRPDLPVVVSDGLAYIPIAHYASQEWASRFVAVVDEKEALAYAGTDSIDKALAILKTCIPLNVYEYQEFAAKYRTFLILTDGAEPWDWWVTRFVREGQAMHVVAKNSAGAIYLVALNTPANH